MSNRDFVKKVRASVIAMRPVLPLSQRLELGSVGTIDEGGEFRYLGTIGTMLGLNSLGGELAPVVRPDLPWSISSGKDVSVGIGAKADTSGAFTQFANAKGVATITFGSADSSFIAVKGLTVRGLAQPQYLINAMLSAYNLDPNRWHKDWVFIYQLGIAHNYTIVLNHEQHTKVLLKGSAKATAGASGAVDLASNFKFEISTNSVEQVVGAKMTIAFYNAYRIKDGVFSRPHAVLAKSMAFGTELRNFPKTDLKTERIFSKV